MKDCEFLEIINNCKYINDDNFIIVIDFKEWHHYNYYGRNRNYENFILFHFVNLDNFEITTIRALCYNISCILNHFEYHKRTFNICECQGEKCREFTSESLCTSCNDPDYLNLIELLELFYHIERVNDNFLHIIKNTDDGWNILNDYLQQIVSFKHDRIFVDLKDEQKQNIIDIIFNLQSDYEFVSGPDPSELPVPTFVN